MNKITYLNVCGDFYIYTTIDKFLEYDPPCKECLVQSICLKDISYYRNTPDKEFICADVDICKTLKKFIENNNLFEKLKIDIITEKDYRAWIS